MDSPADHWTRLYLEGYMHGLPAGSESARVLGARTGGPVGGELTARGGESARGVCEQTANHAIKAQECKNQKKQSC